MFKPNRKSKAHDLNARTFEMVRELGCTWSQARKELSRRANAVRCEKLRLKRSAAEDSERRFKQEERMGLH
jgi:hypothetical protein